MMTCQICLKECKKLKFPSKRIRICSRCANFLNKTSEQATDAEARIREMLKRGIERNSISDLESHESWKVKKAAWRLENLEQATNEAFPDWLNKKLADVKNIGRDFKILRAYRRGIINFEASTKKAYPKNWDSIASRVRKLDHHKCASCECTDMKLDVHHIIYRSNLGTHRKSNLITLCRKCHESEHKRSFDFEESLEPLQRESQTIEENAESKEKQYHSTSTFVGKKTIINCPSCTQKLRVPSNMLINIKCPACSSFFELLTK